MFNVDSNDIKLFVVSVIHLTR